MAALNSLISECARDRLAEGRCTIEEMASYAEARYAGEIEAAGRSLASQQVRVIVKRILRELSSDDDSGQPAIPGLGLPTTIAVRQDADEEPIYYVRADMAYWKETLAGRVERVQNIDRAVERLRRYDAALERLRPWMENDPTCTVADALRREAAARALVDGSEVSAK